MAKNAMGVNLRQSILKSFGRYIAIVMIIALGSAIFVGLLMTKSDMVLTGQEYTDDRNMFDLRLISTYGWGVDQVEKAAQLPGVTGAEGVLYSDLIAALGSSEDEKVFRFYAIPETVNLLNLQSGRMPQRPDECLADGFLFDESSIGTTVTLSSENDEDAWDSMLYKSYTIVGCVSSPLYMDMNRGTTTVGSGSLDSYFYIPRKAFDLDYYTELHLTLPGENALYTREYHDFMEEELERLEPAADTLAEERYQQVREEALSAYKAGYDSYLIGLDAFMEGKRDFDKQIIDARKKLEDAEKKLEDTRINLLNAEQRLKDAEISLQIGEQQLIAYEQQLHQQKSGTEAMLADVTNNQIPAAQAALSSLTQGGMTDEEFAAKQQELQNNLNMLYGQQAAYQNALNVSIPAGFQQIAEQRSSINQSWIEVRDGFGQVRYGWSEMTKAKDELAEAWVDFEEGKEEGEEELREAKADLLEANEEILDALQEIVELEPPDVFVLDRTSNIGYNSLDSSSDIVAGVSRVIPVFFLLVASLVCITTMTRMVDEERTQIGTLKALGYSNGAIISKYLVYAGSGAVLGCGLGVTVGSIVFPKILWDAYKIMLCVRDDVSIAFNWWLCGAVVAVYTAVILLVTWYCCRKALQEVPAELIRPKAPDPGKQLLVEKIPLWKHVSFLNKVMVRNIFRYKQRLAMMLVGIGGCTALLVTGFGLRDSIVGVVDYQFENVTVYDLEVYFNGHQSPAEQKRFVSEVGDRAENILFYHQSSVDLEYTGVTKEVYMISSGPELSEFINLHADELPVSMPGIQEVVLSSGVSEALGIQIGDSVLLRNADMQTMDLTVSGIYENHVYNYAIVLPQTIAQAWDSEPEMQMAYVQVPESLDTHALTADISEMDDVMNVTISEDLAEMVGTMMQALDLVVVVIVFCAGLLAAIVLYNLTNININERIREIATIKVLGFNASETAAYVFKENLTLTVAGSLLGLAMGKLLLLFVMSQVKIDMVWFKTMVEPMSYVWSVVLTMAASFIVDFLFYFKLDKINMAEALKSVE